MKKAIFYFGVILTAIMLYACSPSYEKEAGIYELYEMSGEVSLSYFEYYTIELFDDGSLTIKSKSSVVDSEVLIEYATYRIQGKQITTTTKVGFTNIKEVYDFINEEIHMNDVELTMYGITVSAKFRKTE